MQKRRPAAGLLRAAFSEHRPAKPSLVQRRKCSKLLFGGQTHGPCLQLSPVFLDRGKPFSKNTQQGGSEHIVPSLTPPQS